MKTSYLDDTVASRSILNKIYLTLLTVFLVTSAGVADLHGQSSAEFFSGSMASPPTGPITAAQTARLLLNTDNPTGNTVGTTNTTVNVTASLSNQQFTGVNTGTGNPVVMFGATLNSANSTPVGQATFRPMNVIGGGVNTNFSNTAAGTTQGMDVATNNAFNMFTSVRQWTTGILTDPATNARVRMADLTLTFSSPVTNPLIQIVGTGGTAATGQGFATELTLVTAGLTLTRVQGNAALTTTATQINNGSATIAATCTTTAGCGTVRVNGSNITTITFQVFVRGDGGSLTTWSNTTTHPGDQWLLAVSLPEAYNISGTVFHDANGLSDGRVNGTGFGRPSNTPLYANLVDPTDGTVIGSVLVANNGTYTFTGVPGGGVNYRVDISTNQGIALAAAPARALPTVWNFAGENLGSGVGSDGTPNGALTVPVGTANVTEANFGIQSTVSASNASVGGQILTASARGVRNVRVTLTESDGTVHHAVTGGFGYYQFDHISVGQTVIIEVASKRYTFSVPTFALDVSDNVSGINFIANEE